MPLQSCDKPGSATGTSARPPGRSSRSGQARRTPTGKVRRGVRSRRTATVNIKAPGATSKPSPQGHTSPPRPRLMFASPKPGGGPAARSDRTLRLMSPSGSTPSWTGAVAERLGRPVGGEAVAHGGFLPGHGHGIGQDDKGIGGEQPPRQVGPGPRSRRRPAAPRARRPGVSRRSVRVWVVAAVTSPNRIRVPMVRANTDR